MRVFQKDTVRKREREMESESSETEVDTKQSHRERNLRSVSYFKIVYFSWDIVMRWLIAL